MRLIDHIQKFQHFVNVVESGSISKGAQKSFLTQPQMTKIIKQLEEVISQNLLIRSKEGIKLTPKGLVLYKHAKKTIEATNSLELELINQSLNQGGHIRIGTYDSIARYFFPEFIKYINKVAPLLKISMVTNKSTLIQKELKSGELDIAIIVDAKKSKGIHLESIYTDYFKLYSPKSSSEGEIPNRLIYFNNLEDVVNGLFPKSFEETIKCDNIETVKTLTEQGLGHGFLPTKVSRDGILQNKITSYSGKFKNSKELKHEISFCMKKNEERAEVFFLKNEVKRYLQLWSNS